MAATPPPYAPNVVNQTVDYGGATWKGDPGGGWHLASTDTRDSSYVGTDYASIAKQQMKMMQEANQPAIQSLQASIPETQQKYAAQQQRLTAQQAPLEQRYQSLLNEVTRQGEANISDTQTSTAREFGKRGISLQSGIYDQTLNKNVTPIREWMANQTMGLGADREKNILDLQNLIAQTGESGIDSVRQIQNAIAQLQAGGAQSGITNALNLYQLQQNQALKERELALQEAAANAKVDVNPLEQLLAEAQLQKLLAETARINRSGTGGGGGGGGASLDVIFG